MRIRACATHSCIGTPWIWVSAALALLAAGFLVWALVLRSDLDRAESQFRQAYEMIKSLAGESDLQTASAANNLASCLLDMGHAEQAAGYYSRALEIRPTGVRWPYGTGGAHEQLHAEPVLECGDRSRHRGR